MTSNNHHALHPRDDRETLSALFDGELAADAMRFALKRLDHDAGWRNTCGRWVMIGDAMRGERAIAAPSDFASGVMQLLASETHALAAPSVAAQASQAALSAQGVSRRRWAGGAALAVSVAMAAVLVVRPFSEPSPGSSAQQIAAGTVAPATTTQATPSQPGQAVAPVSIAPASAAGASSLPAVAAVDAPQPTTGRRSARSARAASLPTHSAIATPAGEPAAVVASAEPATGHQPFHPPTDDIVTRPWPRAVLSGNANTGALTVDFGTGSASPSFYPFEPRLPSQDPGSAPQAPKPQP